MQSFDIQADVVSQFVVGYQRLRLGHKICLGCIPLFVLVALLAVVLLTTKLNYALLFILFGLFISVAALCYSIYILIWIMTKDEGNQAMREVASCIKQGSEGFFKAQYGTIFKLSIVFCFFIVVIYYLRKSPLQENTRLKNENANEINEQGISNVALAIFSGSSFLFGALCSALSGYVGMWVSVRANVRYAAALGCSSPPLLSAAPLHLASSAPPEPRPPEPRPANRVASAAGRCYNEALNIAFRGGYFAAIINIALAIFGINALFLVIYFYLLGVYQDPDIAVQQIDKIPLLIIGKRGARLLHFACLLCLTCLPACFACLLHFACLLRFACLLHFACLAPFLLAAR